MRKTVLFLVALMLGLTAFLPVSTVYANGDQKGEVVVANRGSGSISVISTQTDELIGTIPLPAGDNPPEPGKEPDVPRKYNSTATSGLVCVSRMKSLTVWFICLMSLGKIRQKMR